MLHKMINYIKYNISLKTATIVFLSAGILAFGMYNIHSISGVTEGGILGLTLLIEYWFDISPAISGFIMNAASYLIGFKLLGKTFMVYSMIASSGFSFFYAIFEKFEPIYPEIATMPLVAAIVGGLFVGISCGICVRHEAATGGDDALAMSIAKLSGFKIEHIYLISDLSVLVLSLSYIPFHKIIYSLITVVISGKVIGFVQDFKLEKRSDLVEA